MTAKNEGNNQAEGAAKTERPELSFESGLERLEKIVKELEQGDLSLDRALELFEEGMKISGVCRRQLEEAENKVELLVKKGDGKMATEPFPVNENDESS